MIGFAARNLKMFFRDKTSVFFSLLAVFIIIALYLMFLGDAWASGIQGTDNARPLIDSWIMAGLLAVVAVTSTMGAFNTMVDDKEKGIIKDFYSSPVKRSALAGGYILSAFVIGVIMALVALVIAEAYIVLNGGELLEPVPLMQVIGVILLSSFTNTTMIFVIVSFMKSQSSFSTASTVVGTLIGFLTGIYMPIGMMPEAIQVFIKAFPPSHAAVLFRQIMAEPVVAETFSGAPAEYADGFREMMGVTFTVGDSVLSAGASIAYLLGTGIVFFILTVWRVSVKAR